MAKNCASKSKGAGMCTVHLINITVNIWMNISSQNMIYRGVPRAAGNCYKQ